MKKKTIFFICFFLLPSIIIGFTFAFMIISNYFPFDKTNPEMIFEKSEGSLLLTPKSYLDFKKYYEINKPIPQTNSINNNRNPSVNSGPYKLLTIPTIVPLKYSFNDYITVNPCKTKFIMVNFSNYKDVNFNFNYSNSHLNYKIRLYNDVYTFSDTLKSEDCYIDEKNYAKSFFEDPYNNNFIKSVSNDFKKLKNQGYSDDEIVEIVTIFVQSITYGSDTSKMNRYPYETLYEKNGNCLDKSVILAGILKNFNYNVSIVTGNTDTGKKHAIVGLQWNNSDSNLLSDCYIETTNFYPISSNVSNFLSNRDSVILINSGTNIYSEKNYGPKLYLFLEEQRDKVKQIVNKIDNQINELDEIQNDLYDIKNKMSSTDCAFSKKYCWDAIYYNTLLRQYNSKIDDYNKIIDEYTPLILQIYKIKYDYEVKMFDNVN